MVDLNQLAQNKVKWLDVLVSGIKILVSYKGKDFFFCPDENLVEINMHVYFLRKINFCLSFIELHLLYGATKNRHIKFCVQVLFKRVLPSSKPIWIAETCRHI